MTLPSDYFYSEDHVWAKPEGDRIRIGVTAFAQEELGEVVFVELPELGDEVEADEPFGSVESVKTVSELYAPINGRVIEINEELADRPELINESPYEDAWLIAVEPVDESELEELLSAEAYEEFVEE